MSRIGFRPEAGQTPVSRAVLIHPFLFLGGPLTTNVGDHVDILGRSSLNDMILKVAGGKGHTIDNHIVSNILEYADKVAIRDDDE